MLILESVSHVAQASMSSPEMGSWDCGVCTDTLQEADLSGLRHVSSILSLSHLLLLFVPRRV